MSSHTKYIATTPDGDKELPSSVGRNFNEKGFSASYSSSSNVDALFFDLHKLDEVPIRIYYGDRAVGGAVFFLKVTITSDGYRVDFNRLRDLSDA